MKVKAENLIVKTWVEEQTKSPENFLSEIHAEDEMYGYALQNLGDRDRATIRYYFIGKRILEAVKQVIDWHFEKSEISSFLDFACGYGRFTRYLLQELPVEKIWAADICEEAVKFQTEYLGVNGVVSTTNPADCGIDGKFDCILACSFFSHVPEKRFGSWIGKLYDLLTADGVLMFSVHDEALLPPDVEIGSEGILFAAASESRRLDKEEYGTTYVNEAFVKKIVDEVSGTQAFVGRIKNGICGYQDLYVVTKKRQKDFDALRFRYHPKAAVDYCQVVENCIRLKGWAFDVNPDGKIEEILIYINGKLFRRCQISDRRPDVVEKFQKPELLHSGWSGDLPTEKISLNDAVSIKAINNYGWEWIMEVNTLEAILSLY